MESLFKLSLLMQILNKKHFRNLSVINFFYSLSLKPSRMIKWLG
ncbi:hypothetical protein NEOC65_000221 [Neochlamydia sp. AcF65]|nr:hypothetical protein [Neochlamydia sp. AcF65]